MEKDDSGKWDWHSAGVISAIVNETLSFSERLCSVPGEDRIFVSHGIPDSKIRRRTGRAEFKASVADNLMACAKRIEIDPVDKIAVTTFRDVSWRWVDILVGFTPIVFEVGITTFLNLVPNNSIPLWFWIPFALLQLGWMFTFPLWRARQLSSLPSLPKARSIPIEAFIALLIVPIVLLTNGVVVWLMSRFLRQNESANPIESIAGAPERYQSVALVLATVVLAPLAEEVFFRGLFFNALRQRFYPILAALLQGAVFGLTHPFGLAERIGIATIGFWLAMLYQWRKTLVAPILLHAMINSVAMGVLFYSLAIAADIPVLGVRGTTEDRGCLITELVAGGAAAEAGLLVGDIITGAGENSVRNQNDLILIMQTKKIGGKIPVWYLRGGELFQVEAVLKRRPK